MGPSATPPQRRRTRKTADKSELLTALSQLFPAFLSYFFLYTLYILLDNVGVPGYHHTISIDIVQKGVLICH